MKRILLWVKFGYLCGIHLTVTDNPDGTYSITVHYDGCKIYEYDQSNNDRPVYIGWRLRDGRDMVMFSSIFAVPTDSYGSFEDVAIGFSRLPGGTYHLEVISTVI